MGKKLYLELKGHYSNDGSILSLSPKTRLVEVDLWDKETRDRIADRVEPEDGYPCQGLVEKDGKSWWKIIRAFEPFAPEDAAHDGLYPVAHEITWEFGTYLAEARRHVSGKYPHGYFNRPEKLTPIHSNVRPSKPKECQE